MSYFLVTESRGPTWDVRRPRREQIGFHEHAAFMDQLTDAGTILLGGPLGDDVDAGDVVLAVRAADETEAREKLALDPWVGTVLTIAGVQRWSLWLRAGGLGVEP